MICQMKPLDLPVDFASYPIPLVGRKGSGTFWAGERGQALFVLPLALRASPYSRAIHSSGPFGFGPAARSRARLKTEAFDRRGDEMVVAIDLSCADYRRIVH